MSSDGVHLLNKLDNEIKQIEKKSKNIVYVITSNCVYNDESFDNVIAVTPSLSYAKKLFKEEIESIKNDLVFNDLYAIKYENNIDLNNSNYDGRWMFEEKENEFILYQNGEYNSNHFIVSLEQREAEEQELLKAIEQVKDIIKDNIINFEYKTKNNRTFSVISLNKDIGEMEKSLIKGQLDNKIYHIEISNNDNGKNVIEIHLKSSFNQEQELGKEKNK